MLNPLKAIAVGLIFAAAVGTTACTNDAPTPNNTPETDKAVATESVETQHESSSSSGGFCMPCVGPHLTLDGKFGVFSMGPGLSF